MLSNASADRTSLQPRDRQRVLRLRGTVTMRSFRGRFGLVPWIVSVATVAAIGFGLFHKAVAFSQTDATADGTPVVLELFTSEGCSSCPPPDALLSDLGSSTK